VPELLFPSTCTSIPSMIFSLEMPKANVDITPYELVVIPVATPLLALRLATVKLDQPAPAETMAVAALKPVSSARTSCTGRTQIQSAMSSSRIMGVKS
jgi:hypothetical protein